jgi:hypothetical protein
MGHVNPGHAGQAMTARISSMHQEILDSVEKKITQAFVDLKSFSAVGLSFSRAGGQ